MPVNDSGNAICHWCKQEDCGIRNCYREFTAHLHKKNKAYLQEHKTRNHLLVYEWVIKYDKLFYWESQMPSITDSNWHEIMSDLVGLGYVA